uniref:Uncharacterized protein n=1 Tax=Anguilla anguilla TaxID=7936 RepID=A0A0E9WPZ1_ANGAN
MTVSQITYKLKIKTELQQKNSTFCVFFSCFFLKKNGQHLYTNTYFIYNI